MRETLSNWHEQRSKWYRSHDATPSTACPCGKCSKGSAYREASSSLGKEVIATLEEGRCVYHLVSNAFGAYGTHTTFGTYA